MERTAASSRPGGQAARGRLDGELLDVVARRLGITISRAFVTEVIHGGDHHLARLLQAIAAARRDVAIEMYEIRRDPVGTAVAAALEHAAARGIRVRLLTDAWGSMAFAGGLERLRRRGVDARWYGPWRVGTSPLRRSHRKLVIVDGESASVGGVNLTEQFSERQRGANAWRDVTVWLHGLAARRLAAQFEAAWSDHGGARLPAPDLREAGGGRCLVIGGRDGRQGHAAAYAALVGAARHEVLIANPYFMPDRRFRACLAAAARRGVRVVVVTPRLSDVEPFKHAGRRLYAGLLASGVEIWERSDRMVHAKVAVVDRVLAAVGSTNINRRSFSHNSEALLITEDPAVVGDLTSFVLAESLASAEQLQPAGWRRHPDRRFLAELLAAPVGVLF
jgi:cardiolipin synthase